MRRCQNTVCFTGVTYLSITQLYEKVKFLRFGSKKKILHNEAL
jgi:hypothetical protein